MTTPIEEICSPISLFEGEIREFYYHGTSEKNADSILANGLDPEKSLFDKKIFLIGSRQQAERYSKNGKGQKGKVLRISANGLDPSKMSRDTTAGVVKYQGFIDPKYIMLS
jgi:hypothetical protein